MSAANDDHINLGHAAGRSGHAVSASEQLFFLNMPVAHIVAYEARVREDRQLKAGALQWTDQALRFFGAR